VVGLVKSATTRVSTAARSASARFIQATRITARVSNSIRLAEIASQQIANSCFSERNRVCSLPVPGTFTQAGGWGNPSYGFNYGTPTAAP